MRAGASLLKSKHSPVGTLAVQIPLAQSFVSYRNVIWRCHAIVHGTILQPFIGIFQALGSQFGVGCLVPMNCACTFGK